MDWPSERVQQGGIFHSHKVNYSPQTQQLLKLLMEESRLTMLQRKKINYHLRNGEPLPIFPENKKPPKADPAPSHLRARSCRRRTLDAIKESDAFNIEKFIPKNAYKESSETSKLRLQQKMSGFKEDPELAKFKLRNRYKYRKNMEDDEEINLEDELIREINERIEWLDDMEKLGEAKRHRLVIQSQIQDRLLELKRLTNQRKQ